MNRNYCLKCAYPQSTCLCAERVLLSSATCFHIIQHPNEAGAAKNTAKLVKLCLPDTQIWPGESPEDLQPFRHHLEDVPKPTAVLYPCRSAKTLNEVSGNASSEVICEEFENIFDRIVLIDATWRKAHKIWMLNPWLHTLPALKFDTIDSEYHVRLSRIPGALSTLESVYHYLKVAEPQQDFSALISIFHARQAMLKPR